MLKIKFRKNLNEMGFGKKEIYSAYIDQILNYTSLVKELKNFWM